MSKSRNVRSRYQGAPSYVLASVREKDSGGRVRVRDQRSKGKREVRAIIEEISTLSGTGEDI